MVQQETGLVLLMESDESVIKDVSCSLRLIDIPVVSALSVQEAEEIISERKPTLVLARLRLTDDTDAGVELAEKAASKNANANVYLLCTPSEQASVDEATRKYFAGEILLPVEFPAFPQQISNLIGGTPLVNHESIKPPVQAVSGVSVRQDIPDSTQTLEADVETKDRNFSIAYAIQSRVLRELENDGRLNSARAEQVPGILNQVTAKVCVKYATDKFFD